MRDSVTGDVVQVDLSAGTTERTVTGLVTARDYAVSLLAYDIHGNFSASTDEVVAAPADEQAPFAPTGLVCADVPQDEGGAIALTWQPSPESDLAGYTIWRAEVPAGTDPAVASVTALPIASVCASSVVFTDKAALLGILYCYYLTAADVWGNVSAPSAVATASTTDDMAPSAPLAVAACDVPGDEGGVIDVAWTPSPSSDVAGYRVIVRDPSGFAAKSIMTPELTACFDGLSSGLEYSVSVVAIDSAGNESPATVAWVVPVDDTAPAAPVGVYAADVAPDQGGAVTVSWAAGAEADLAGYIVTCVDASGSVVSTVSVGFATSHTFEGLQSGCIYAFLVEALDINGNVSRPGGPAYAAACDEIAPDTPSILSAADMVGDETGSVVVKINPSASLDTAGHLLLCRDAEGESVRTVTLSASETTVVVSGLAERMSFTFTLVAFDRAGNVSAESAAVTATPLDDVAPAPVASVEATDRPNDAGGAATVTWSASLSGDVATYRVLRDDVQVVETSSTTVTDTGLTNGREYKYQVVAVDDAGNVSEPSAPALATPHDDTSPAPTVAFGVTPERIFAGEGASLSWSVANAAMVTIDNGIGLVLAQGIMGVAPADDTTYTLTAVGPGGTATRSVNIEVLAVEPQPTGTFGEQYEDLIPTDATIDAYDPERFAAVSGRIIDTAGQPVEGARVFVEDKPELGNARADGDGAYAMALEGGATERVTIEADGYIAVTRQVATQWNAIAHVDDVTLTPLDTAATPVEFGADSAMAVHRASAVSDERGERFAAVVFPEGTSAWSVDEDGTRHPLDEGVVRATEFTSPEAMPAKLPAASAFTYCVELSVDGAREVEFDRPVVLWMPDFLDMPVGVLVPVGYYDRDRGVWVPSDNGFVVRLLDADSNGVVDGLDGTGDGEADDIDGDHETADEVEGVSAAGLVPGQVVWRSEVTHFSPWDCNHGFVVVAQGSVTPPSGNNPNVSGGDGPNCPVPAASTVRPQSGVVEEDLRVAGTGMTLHYSSERSPGYQTVVDVPLIGADVPPSLMKIVATLDIAGRHMVKEFDPEPNLSTTFTWDGKDLTGKRASGDVRGTVGVTYRYRLAYAVQSGSSIAEPYQPNLLQAGLRLFGSPPPPPRPRTEGEVGGVETGWTAVPAQWAPRVELSRDYEIVANRPDVAHEVAPQWTLSAVHHADSVTRSLVSRGDGTEVRPSTSVLQRVYAQSVGEFAMRPDGRLLVPAGILDALDIRDKSSGALISRDWLPGRPTKITLAPDGTTYARCADGRIFRRDIAGWTHVAGAASTAAGVVPSNGVTATAASLGSILGLAADSAGNVYVSVDSSKRVFRIDVTGVLHEFAGGGSVAVTSTSVPATEAAIYPTALAVSPTGDVYVADHGAPAGARVYRVDPTGVLTPVAGTHLKADAYYQRSTKDFDGCDALESYVGARDLAIAPSGRLAIAGDTVSKLVYEVDEEGRLVTVAGSKNGSVDVYPVPAREGSINPGSIDYDAVGTLYVYHAAVNGGGLLKVASDAKVFPKAPGTGFSLTEGPGVAHRFAADGTHLSSFDPATGVTLTRIGHDEAGRVTNIVDRFGRGLELERDGDTLTLIAPDGQRTRVGLGVDGTIGSVTYDDGSTWRVTYDKGLLDDVEDPSGAVAHHDYDAHGHATHVTGSDGVSTSFAKSADATGVRSVTVTSGDGTVSTTRTWSDGNGRSNERVNDAGAVFGSYTRKDGMVTSTRHPSGSATTRTMTWDTTFGIKIPKLSTERLPKSGLTRTTEYAVTYPDPNRDGSFDRIERTVKLNGRASKSVQDLASATVTLTSPAGRVAVSRYDTATLLTTRVDSGGLASSTFGYDAAGRLTTMTTGARTVSYSHDASGNVSAITGPDGTTSTFEYDVMGRVTVQHRPDGSSIRFFHDALGNTTRIVVPSGAEHDFTSNPRGARLSYTTPLGGAYSYHYDDARRLKSVTSPSGSVVTNTYTHGFLTSVTAGDDSISLVRAICGRLDGAVRGAERSTVTYDGMIPVSEKRSGAVTSTLSWTYNTDFAPASFGYAESTQTLGYDADGLLTTATPFAIRRTSDSGLATTVTAPGFTLKRTYSSYGEVDSADYGAYSYALTRDTAGRITGRTEVAGGTTTTWGYTYDTLGRLTSVTRDGQPAESYSYDEQGRRTSFRVPLRGIDTTQAAVFDAEDRVSASGEATYSFTADGFVASKASAEGTTTYTYTAFGELARVTLPDGRRVDYTYDASGRRTSKAIDGAITERYLWADTTRLLATYDGSGALTRRFLYADARTPYAMDTPAGRRYLAFDQVGSLRAVTDTSGAVTGTMRCDSYGNVVSASGEATAVGLGFAGGLTDADTHLVLFGARDYDASQGRWMAKDPIGFEGGDVDLYGYCLGDPVGLVDPAGLRSECGGGGGGAECDTDLIDHIGMYAEYGAGTALQAVGSMQMYAGLTMTRGGGTLFVAGFLEPTPLGEGVGAAGVVGGCLLTADGMFLIAVGENAKNNAQSRVP